MFNKFSTVVIYLFYLAQCKIYAVLIVSKVQNVMQITTFCRHNSKCDCKMLKVAVIIRNLTVIC